MKFGKQHWNRLPFILAVALMMTVALFVFACSSSDDSKPAPAAADETAPSVPANVLCSAVSASQIDISWDASTDDTAVTGYRVLRDGTALGTVTTTSYSDTGLAEGTMYTYTVTAYDAAGNESAESTPISETTLTTGVSSATNVFLDSILPDANYTFFHGSTSPDGSKMLIAVNKSASPQEFPPSVGAIDLYMLDAAELEKGTVSLIANSTVTGVSGSVAFRSNWSADGTEIAMGGADRFYVINSTTLAVENGATGDQAIGGENHDAMFTDDGKYAILTLRDSSGAFTDGTIQVYDVANGQQLGNTVSVCNGCHTTQAGGEFTSVLCGLDGEVAAQGDGTYAGTVYIAGHGGHFAKVDLTIDPSNTTDPITSASLNRIIVSGLEFAEGGRQYLLHDARVDYNTNALYWSTYNTDANGKVHYGSNDLTSGAVTADVAADVDARALIPGTGLNKKPIYCASGQTTNYFMPITMTHEAYISVIPKDTITGIATAPASGVVSTATDVFMPASIVPDINYVFFHGSTSHDGSKMLLAVNDSSSPGNMGTLTGNVDLYMLNAQELEKGNAALDTTVSTSSSTITGVSGSIAFRSTWSADDTKIAMGGADRFYVIDADTLAVENGATGDQNIGGENHDAMFTSDGKYAILTLRGPDQDGTTTDGFIQVYDVVNGQQLGNTVSVCNGCHGANAWNSVLCGLDGEVALDAASGYGGDTYSGTIYVAGHGGHFAKVDLTIDPSNTTDPITVVGSLTRENISTVELADGSRKYLLHDARIDGDTLYWSTYNLDENNQVHYGSYDLTGHSVIKDVAVDPPGPAEGVTIPTIAEGAKPYYCASGQTDNYFMPITMTNEAYISVIPKLDLQ